jgi:hypothetical protein
MIEFIKESNMTKQIIGAQGEITIIKLDEIPEGIGTRPAEKCAKGWIISHSESGHHHILTGGDVREATGPTPSGLKVFYALLDQPQSLIQDADAPHGGYDLAPGAYCFRIAREYDPFAKQNRPVID